MIYASQVFWHIQDKQNAISKIAGLLKKDGIFVLSIDKVQPSITDFSSRRIRMFPDNKEAILKFITNSHLSLKHTKDIENASIIVAYKDC